MAEKSAASKRNTLPAKQAPAARKSAMAKPLIAKLAPVKAIIAVQAGKKNKKAKKVDSKVKVVRDSFTMPQADYEKIAELKQVCLKAGLRVKKSELLRAGLHALGKLSASQLERAMAQMEKIKAGRPKNG